MSGRGVRWIVALVAGGASVAALAPGAGAVVTIGSLQEGSGGTSCSAPMAMVQANPPEGETYTAPSDGVVTSFTFAGSTGGLGTTTQTKLLVLDSLGGANYRVTAAGQLETVNDQALATRTTRLPIATGQVIGLYGFTCRTQPAGAGMVRSIGSPAPEPPAGGTTVFPTLEPGRMLLQATIEPDCDNDGFGDESQDNDLSPCPPAPTATITGWPKEKVKSYKKRAKATFTFTSDDPGATFNCILDGKQEFRACTSPLTVTVKKGKHTFSVTATDAGGNSGAAAADNWKVKRKKKKRR